MTIQINIQVDSVKYALDLTHPFEIAMALDFTKNQPNVHGIEKASAISHEIIGMIGDVAQGGSCNWQQYTLTPHSHGTHTECVGHITHHTVSIHEAIKALLIPSTLISITPTLGSACSDTYFPIKHDDDLLITHAALKEKLHHFPIGFSQGMIIRTLPNGPFKATYDYQKNGAPFFSKEALEYLLSRGVEHLLVDFPSVDAMHDDGHMLIHHLFWNVPLGEKEPTADSHLGRTITELIYVDPAIPDGLYALNIQIPCFATDAAPSRPLLFSVIT